MRQDFHAELLRQPEAEEQDVDERFQAHTARTMLDNREFLVMLNQASTDGLELTRLLNISHSQLSYITKRPAE
ncbi:hypothetical protein [uncultured Intestinimonas sp.]|uniref:hypothetical protein n=1 Tax=uncultured Intestinimonas sp. TaxID=1689265 RepID=UPI0025E4F988|nr:hypothetical protein [uncultured Intestinimonas sp.]